jgi:hypothetical protein
VVDLDKARNGRNRRLGTDCDHEATPGGDHLVSNCHRPGTGEASLPFHQAASSLSESLDGISVVASARDLVPDLSGHGLPVGCDGSVPGGVEHVKRRILAARADADDYHINL